MSIIQYVYLFICLLAQISGTIVMDFHVVFTDRQHVSICGFGVRFKLFSFKIGCWKRGFWKFTFIL